MNTGFIFYIIGESKVCILYIKFCLVFFLSKHAKQLLLVTFFDTPTGVGASQSFVTQAEGQTETYLQMIIPPLLYSMESMVRTVVCD